jgi:long-chain acyl-CoA synthetase
MRQVDQEIAVTALMQQKMTTTPNLLGTRVPRFTSVLSLHGKFRKNHVAIKFPGEDFKSMTYGQFVSEMNSVGMFVKKNQLANKRIATLLTNDTPRTLTTMFGCVHGGACLVPLNASLKPNQIQSMLTDCNAKMIVASEKYSALIPEEPNNFECIGFDFQNNRWKKSDALFSSNLTDNAFPESEINNESAEFNIIYTSGTTGTPKGIVQTHANRLHWAWSNAITMRYQADSKALTTTALYSNGTFLVTLPTLFVGATLHVMKQFDPLQTLQIIQNERITHVFMVPTQLKMCLDAGASKFDLSSLKMVLSAGSTLASELKKRVLKEITPNLFELYGNSEGFASMLFPEEHSTKFQTVGRPLLGNDLKIVESEGSKELAQPHDVGEICVRGPGMMLSYNNREEDTINEIWQDPVTKLKYFRSGDMGKVDEDGYLTLMERKKDMIISGGFNVFPKDIEDIMLQNSDIHDVAVVSAPHEKWGETPVAIVIPQSGSCITAEAIKEWTNTRVSKVQRISHVKLLAAGDAFPRNVLGKVMKKELRSKLNEWGLLQK